MGRELQWGVLCYRKTGSSWKVRLCVAALRARVWICFDARVLQKYFQPQWPVRALIAVVYVGG